MLLSGAVQLCSKGGCPALGLGSSEYAESVLNPSAVHACEPAKCRFLCHQEREVCSVSTSACKMHGIHF